MKHLKNMNESFKDRRRKQIEDEIAKKQAELDGLSNKEDVPVIELSDYTDEEKVKYFDSMYKMAFDHLKSVEDSGYKDDDAENWFFEEGFKILNIKNPKSLWNYYNKLN